VSDASGAVIIAISLAVGTVGIVPLIWPYTMISLLGRLSLWSFRISGLDPYGRFWRKLYTPIHRWLQGPLEGLYHRMRDEPRRFAAIAWFIRFGGAFMILWAAIAMTAGVLALAHS